mmetsp:Transcript_72427/g.120729  ORF Transcript_72427/g.120729 Transcript_72427/m.120729 type:complete len:439 (+) Transcript_72427:69-1385(+)
MLKPILLLVASTAALTSAPLHPRVVMLLDQLKRERALEPRGDSAVECLATDFGARCDGITNDTLALQKAIDVCSGTVSLPNGRTCLTHGLALRNGTRFKIPGSAVLKAFPNATAWNNKSLHLIEVRDVRDVVVFGGGTVDGSGSTWWQVAGGDRPHMFYTGNMHNITFRDLKLVNSGRGLLGLGAPCSNVIVDNLTLLEPAIANSDGIDISCDGFVVQNCHVQNGDDSICMKSKEEGSARNGLVRNCTIRNGVQLLPATRNYPGHAGGLVLGTAVSPAMENITFSNCTVEGALAGIRIKFRPSQFGFARNVLFEGITIRSPIAYAIDVIMDSDHAQAGSPRTVDLQNITMRDVRGFLGPVPRADCGVGNVCPRAVARFLCTAEYPCHNMRLEHVHVHGFKPTPKFDEPCSFTNVSGSGLDIDPPGCTPPSAHAAFLLP